MTTTNEHTERAELIRFLKDHTIGGSEFNRKMARCAAMLEAQRPALKPLTDEQKSAMWKSATIESCSHENCYLRGISDAEAAHGIKEQA